MWNHNERGDGKITGLIMLGALAAFIYATVNVGPTYVAYLNLQDEVTQIARMSIGYKDIVIREKLQEAIDEYELYDYIRAKDFEIRKRSNRRVIDGSFSVTLTVLPNWEKTFNFEVHADEPTF